MATWNGAYNGGGRIEYVYTVGAVSQNTTSVTVSVTAYLRMQGGNSSNGSWPMSWSGAWGSGSSSPSNTIPAGGRVQIRSWSGTVSLTDSTQSRSFQISAQHYWGTTSATLNVSIPARYARTPTGLTVERTSDSRAVLRWTRQSTYTSVGIQFRGNTNGSWGDWVGAGTASGNAASFTKTTGLYANRAYQFRVQGRGGSGASTWSGPSAVIYMTPAPPSNITAARVSNGIRVSIGSMPTHATSFDVWDEATGSIVGSNIPRGSFPWVHTSPNPAVPHRYRVRARQNSGGVNSTTLVSAYSAWSNTVQLQAPPTAPTNLSPNGAVIAVDSTDRFSWRHNPVDSSEQTQYELRYRVSGGGFPRPPWTTLAGSTSDEFRDLAISDPELYDWQVRTRGAHADFSPWSAVATVTVISVPTVAIINPDDEVWTEPTLVVQWNYDQAGGRPQTGWRVEFVDADSDTVLVDESGTGATSSFLLPTRLQPDTNYRIRVWVASSGIWSDYDEFNFVTVFTPPAAPEVEGEWNEEQGSHDLTVIGDRGEERDDIVNLFTNPRLKGNGTWAEVRRNIARNPSAAVDTAQSGVYNTQCLLSRGSDSEGSFFRVESLGGSNRLGMRQSVSIPASADVTVSFEVRVTAATLQRYSGDIRVQIGSATWGNAPAELVADEWALVEITQASPADYANLYISVNSESDWSAGDIADFRRLHVSTGLSGGFFDGSTMDDSMVQPEDFRVRWLGEPNASESVMEIERVRGVLTTGAAAGVSSWNGRPAMRVISQHSAGASTARIVIPEGAWSGGTAIGTLHMREPLRGPLSPDRGGIRVNDPVFRSEKSPNEAGSYEHRVVFTALSSTYQFNLFHGGSIGPDVWWTDIGLFAGEYDGPYFDGSSGQLRIDGTAMNAAWDGEPDNSTSRLSMAEDTVYVVVERSIDGGETWEMVIESPYVEGELSFSDYEGLSCGNTLYRATGYSIADQASVTIVDIPSNSEATYIGGGEGFAQTARIGVQHTVKVSRSRQRTSQHYSGRTLAVGYSSENVDRQVSITATAPDHDSLACATATRHEIDEVVLLREPVHLYRDRQGSHIYGVLGTLSEDRLWTRPHLDCGDPDHFGMCDAGIWGVSLSLSETGRGS